MTIGNRCAEENPCSHLCLIIPSGFKCACPDNKISKNTYQLCNSRK